METKTFENEGFLAEATEEAGCTLSVKVSVKPKQAQKAYQKAVRAVNKQISVPGFRKGHAPDRTVISRFSSQVEQEWKEIVVNEAYRAAIELTDIYPMNKESIQRPKIEQCSLEEGAVVQLAYEHFPIVQRVDFSQITLPSIPQEKVTESKIDEIVEEVRRAHADWEEVSERSVEEGDFVDVSIDAIDEEPPKPIVKDRRFEVTKNRLSPWMQKLLIGLKIGESVEGLSEVDENADKKVKKNFKPTKVRITLHAIKKILLPEADDELAKKSGASSLEDLRSKIGHNLEKEAEGEWMRKKGEALDEALLEHYQFDLPTSLVEEERKERITARLKDLKNRNVSDEEIKSHEKEIEKEVSFEVDRALRLYFLNKQIAKQGSISLTNQELNDEIVRHVSQNPYLYNRESDETVTRDLVSRLASALMQRKTKEYALSQVASVK